MNRCPRAGAVSMSKSIVAAALLSLALPAALAAERIGYRHLIALGGRRHHPRGAPPSTNTFWREMAFRNYADYAMSAEFRLGLDELLALAGAYRCAIMCAEAVWWRCHRSLISDYLKVRGGRVIHILALGKAEEHPYTSAARIVDGELDYSAASREPDKQQNLFT